MDKNFLVSTLCVTVAILAFIAGMTYSSTTKTKAIADMVAKGADPQAAYCALDGVHQGNMQVCVTLATKVQQAQQK